MRKMRKGSRKITNTANKYCKAIWKKKMIKTLPAGWDFGDIL